jgi:hypothetical protein
VSTNAANGSSVNGSQVLVGNQGQLSGYVIRLYPSNADNLATFGSSVGKWYLERAYANMDGSTTWTKFASGYLKNLGSGYAFQNAGGDNSLTAWRLRVEWTYVGMSWEAEISVVDTTSALQGPAGPPGPPGPSGSAATQLVDSNPASPFTPGHLSFVQCESGQTMNLPTTLAGGSYFYVWVYGSNVPIAFPGGGLVQDPTGAFISSLTHGFAYLFVNTNSITSNYAVMCMSSVPAAGTPA